MRSKKVFAVLAGVLSTLGLGSAVALASGNDSWNSTANTNAAWSSTQSGTSTYSVGWLTVSCTAGSSSGKSTGPAPDNSEPMNAPSFSGCTDSNGGTDTVTTSGSWTSEFYSDTGSSLTGCPSGTGADDNGSTADCQTFTIPTGGVSIAISGGSSSGCTIKPTAGAVGGTVTDPTGSASSVAFNAPILYTTSGTNCGSSSGTGTFNATYDLTSPSSGVMYDTTG